MKYDNFDWTRQSRGTSSAGTGPATDHTYQTAVGECSLTSMYHIHANDWRVYDTLLDTSLYPSGHIYVFHTIVDGAYFR